MSKFTGEQPKIAIDELHEKCKALICTGTDAYSGNQDAAGDALRGRHRDHAHAMRPPVGRALAPGLAMDTAEWRHEKQIAGVASGTHAVETRPNPIDNVRQPWHWVTLPNMGVTIGEYFYLAGLSADCAQDSVYEFFFTAPSLPITGAAGCPTNPLVIK